MEGWEKHYPGMIEWQDPKMHGGIKGVDPKTGEVKTDLATYKAALANVIPAQMAGKIARDAGLADQSGFCPIDPENMKSKMDANIFVVGDACIPGDMPKSAFSANSQAKVAAMMIRGELTQVARLPGALFQHLLEPDRAGRRHQGRRELRAGRRQDQADDRASSARRAKPPTSASRTTRSRSTGITASSPMFSADRNPAVDRAERRSLRPPFCVAARFRL